MRLQCLTRACWAYPQFTTPVLSSTVRAWLSPRQYVTDSSLKPPLVPGILSNLVKTLSEYCQTSPKHCPNTVIALSEYCQSTPRKSCTPSHVSPGRPPRVLSSHSRCVVKSSPRHSPSILQSCHRLVLALPPRPVRDYVLPSSSLSSSKRLQISLQTAPEAPRIPSSRSALVSLTLKAISSSSSIPSRLLHQFHLVFFINSISSLHSCLPSSIFTLQILSSLILSSSLLLSSPFPSVCIVLYVFFSENISLSLPFAMISLHYLFLSLFISLLFLTSVFISISSFPGFCSSLRLRSSPSLLILLLVRHVLLSFFVSHSLSYPFFFVHLQCTSSFRSSSSLLIWFSFSFNLPSLPLQSALHVSNDTQFLAPTICYSFLHSV